MEIAILQTGTPADALVASSIIHGLRTKYKSARLFWFANEVSIPVFKYNKHITIEPILSLVQTEFDILVNLSAEDLATLLTNQIKAKERFGFGKEKDKVVFFNHGAERFYNVQHGLKTDAHILQLIYGAAGLAWRGEGYSFPYYPKKKTQHGLIGIAISDTVLRNKVIALAKDKQHKEIDIVWADGGSVFDKADEINQCQEIVTDDLLIAHLGVCLHKYVDFINANKVNYAMQFFGKGMMHNAFQNTFSNRQIPPSGRNLPS